MFKVKSYYEKLRLLIYDSERKGIVYGFRRAFYILFRPFNNFIKDKDFLIELFYGILDKAIFPFISSGLLKFPQTELVKNARNFWYSNTQGVFDLDGEKITRKEFFTYGGPNPKFVCPVCQKSEWLSRVRQKNLFIEHFCQQSGECKSLCQKQGNELWSNLHQNFDFSIGCDPNLPAPKCLFIGLENKGVRDGGFYWRFQKPGCDQLMLVLRRRLAYACQVDLVKNVRGVNFSNYDFIFIHNFRQKFSHPKIPVIMYGHDFWSSERKVYQWMFRWLKPDILLTPYPTQWKENFKLSPNTKIIFYPFFDSLFFTRPNLGEKKIDLLVIGAVDSPIYGQRIFLDKQVSKLKENYNIEFSHRTGALSSSRNGPTHYIDPITKNSLNYLNKWSEYLGSAKYVIFGRMKFQILVSKYYEVLGSGAVPIFPEVPDLKLLGIKPFEHYIPLSEIEGNEDKLVYFLSHYNEFKHIAENAINWYKNFSDKMIFNEFENIIGEIINKPYQKRLV